MTVPPLREFLASLPERRQLVRDVLTPIQRGKRDRTIASTYEGLKPDTAGRIHTGLSVATTSMRLASSETITEDASRNLQNMANKVATLDELYHVRDILCADDGMQLVARDFAGAEMIICFMYAEDWEWVDRLWAGETAHGVHAKEAFKLTCKPEEVKKLHPQVYTTAKNLGFASIYSASARTVTVTFNKDFPFHGQRITEAEVRRFQQVLYDLHPLQEWWHHVEEQIERDGGVVTNCFGYTRPLRDPDAHNRLKDALSFYPQSTVAWKMNETVCWLHENLDAVEEVELLHQVHDEVILQAIPEYVQGSLDATKYIMEQPFEIHERRMYIPTEAKTSRIGGSWGKMETVKERRAA